VSPLTALSSPLSRFWKEDVKIARDFNQTFDGHASLGENFLREWAVSSFTKLKQYVSHYCCVIDTITYLIDKNRIQRDLIKMQS
jgi:hypothetical protein